jgi:hypothetical protein
MCWLRLQHARHVTRNQQLLLLLLLLLLQVYEYDRILLQQDAVQYIAAAYKYELGTNLAALNITATT